LSPYGLKIFQINYCKLQYNGFIRAITNRRLLDFSSSHKDALEPLQSWRKLMEFGSYKNSAEVKQVFRSADKDGWKK
jgi:mRNA-degrading endonuclease HigB of HigAB toxin-antitoxin module